MAFCLAALAAAFHVGLSLAAEAAAATPEACPGITDPTMAMVTSISAECFVKCPQVCKPMASLITEFMKDFDKAKLKQKVCDNRKPFTCFFGEETTSLCKPVLAAGDGMGVKIPSSQLELDSECGDVTEAPGKAPAGRVPTSEAPTGEAPKTAPPADTSTDQDSKDKDDKHHDAAPGKAADYPTTSAACQGPATPMIAIAVALLAAAAW